jgi:hypothetical protein
LFSYQPNGVLSTISRGNGATDTISPDPDGMVRPRSFRVTDGLGAELWTSGAYAFDPAGNITGMGESEFSYDALSRLEAAKTCPDGYDPTLVFRDRFESGDTTVWEAPFPSDPTAAPCVDSSYTFDPYGNLTSRTEAGTLTNTPASTATNRLTSATYDLAGNVTGTGCSFGCATVYEHDDFNMLRRLADGKERYFIYDAFDEHLLYLVYDDSHWTWTVRDHDGSILGTWFQADSDLPRKTQSLYVYRQGQPLAARIFTNGTYSPREAPGTWAAGHPTFQWGYDHGWLTVTRPSGQPDLASFSYQPNGLLSTINRGNGLTDTIASDPDGIVRSAPSGSRTASAPSCRPAATATSTRRVTSPGWESPGSPTMA